MCLVEFPGPRGSRLDTACTVRVSEGMAVVTNSDAVEQAREAVLGFILINHPLDCPICDKGGECPLQDNTMEYGPGASKFVEVKRRKQKHYPISDLIMLDQERCILCWRCIRYLEEWEDKPQIGLFERGGETIIDVFPGRPVNAKTSGSIIDICPVGALTNRVARFRYRPWELKKTPSVCTHCSVGCNLRLDERVHTLRRIVARENMAVNDEWICDKGRFLHQHVDHPQRLTQPLVRDNGQLREATWDEAIARIVDTFERIAEQHGPNATGAIAAGRVSNESGYLLQKFFRQFVGTNNVDFSEGASVAALPTGMPAITDIAKSDVIVLVGFDPSEATPVLDLHIKRAVRRKGARLVIINPRRIEAARYVNDPRGPAGAYIPTRPGDEALALSELAAAVQARKAAVAAAAQKQERGGRPQQGAQAAGSPAVAMTRVARADIDGAAQILAAAKSPLFIYGPDAARGPRGRMTVTALSNVAVALGHGDKLAYVGHEANGQGLRDMGVVANALPGHAPVTDAPTRERLGKLWGVQPPAEPGASYQEMLDGKVRALYLMEADPAASPAAADSLRKLDFVVVQDLFLTETAKLAHVVLPATSWAESEGTYTNLERRIQRGPDGIDSIEGCLPGWAVLDRMAERWTASQTHAAPADAMPEWKRKKRARSDAKGAPSPKPWNYPGAHTVLDEIAKAAPIYAGMRWESLTDQGQQWPATALARPARRYEPVEVEPQPALEAGRFLLVSGPVLWDGSALMQHSAAQLQNLIPGAFVALNPADLPTAGVPDGHGVIVTSPRGSVTAVLHVDDCVQPGTAWMPYGLVGQPAETLGAGRGETVSVTISRAYASLE
jgi:NADH-quinone oxidoreductase chain G